MPGAMVMRKRLLRDIEKGSCPSWGGKRIIVGGVDSRQFFENDLVPTGEEDEDDEITTFHCVAMRPDICYRTQK